MEPGIVNFRTRDLGYQLQTTLVYKDMVFAVKLAPIRWAWPGVLAATRRPHAGGIKSRSNPPDLVVFAEPAQYGLMDTLPNTGLRPFVLVSPARYSATVRKFTRQALPWNFSPKGRTESRSVSPVHRSVVDHLSETAGAPGDELQ